MQTQTTPLFNLSIHFNKTFIKPKLETYDWCDDSRLDTTNWTHLKKEIIKKRNKNYSNNAICFIIIIILIALVVNYYLKLALHCTIFKIDSETKTLIKQNYHKRLIFEKAFEKYQKKQWFYQPWMIQ